ncbi:sugar ABC transporter substrate-binding protein [Phaeacidiphilus oryzae]|uniref:sugar ABC transporter substrate-binding protein n=1 Tax=Phaeacidiphilus oryzae TaxID=348818 RepID=UPI00055C8DDD|nr:extracellular solute-binding protein [Phaeacidiphilus oryzae]
MAVGAVVALTATACGPGTAPAKSGSGGGGSTAAAGSITELDYYTDAAGSAAWQQALSGCTAKTGVKVKRQSVPTDQLIQKVLQGAASHTLPDLVLADNPTLQQIAATGALTPLSQYGISTAGYYDSIVKAGTYQGKVYGLAPGVNGLALIYNKDLLSRAGISAPPATWAQLKADAAKLTKGSTYGLAFSAVNSEEGTWQFLPFFWSDGGDLSKLDSAQGAQALGYVRGLVASGSASKSVVSWNQNDVADQFTSGNAAMMVNGSWTLPALDQQKNLHYGVVPLPTPQAGQKPVVALGGEVGAIPATGTATQKAAAKVLSCILSEPTMLAWDKSHAYIPTRQSTAQTFARQNPELSSFVAEVETARSRTAQLGTAYPKISTALATALQSALTGQQSPAAALAQAQKQASG